MDERKLKGKWEKRSDKEKRMVEGGMRGESVFFFSLRGDSFSFHTEARKRKHSKSKRAMERENVLCINLAL